MADALKRLSAALAERFQDPPTVSDELPELETLARMAARGSCRHFAGRAVAADLLNALIAIAFAAPTKSDLQLRDVIVLRDCDLRAKLADLIGQEWVAAAPELLIFCGNGNRQARLHEWRGILFVNDHLDAFFNAAVDAGIALNTFMSAAEAVGLGCCPISAIRNHPDQVSDLLGLPERVFPVAGLGLGWPKFASPRIAKRLPLSATVHVDRFDDGAIREKVESYDRWRVASRPYALQRHTDLHGEAEFYGWSEEKARHYSVPERATFGAFIKAKGFKLT